MPDPLTAADQELVWAIATLLMDALPAVAFVSAYGRAGTTRLTEWSVDLRDRGADGLCPCLVAGACLHVGFEHQRVRVAEARE